VTEVIIIIIIIIISIIATVCKFHYIEHIKFSLKLAVTKLPVTYAFMGCYIFEIVCNN